MAFWIFNAETTYKTQDKTENMMKVCEHLSLLVLVFGKEKGFLFGLDINFWQQSPYIPLEGLSLWYQQMVLNSLLKEGRT